MNKKEASDYWLEPGAFLFGIFGIMQPFQALQSVISEYKNGISIGSF